MQGYYYCDGIAWQCLRLHTLHLLPWTPYLRGWVLAALLRLLTHSSTPELWREWPVLRELLDLSLKELTESTFGDIFLLLAFLAQSSAPQLGLILKR